MVLDLAWETLLPSSKAFLIAWSHRSGMALASRASVTASSPPLHQHWHICWSSQERHLHDRSLQAQETKEGKKLIMEKLAFSVLHQSHDEEGWRRQRVDEALLPTNHRWSRKCPWNSSCRHLAWQQVHWCSFNCLFQSNKSNSDYHKMVQEAIQKDAGCCSFGTNFLSKVYGRCGQNGQCCCSVGDQVFKKQKEMATITLDVAHLCHLLQL